MSAKGNGSELVVTGSMNHGLTKRELFAAMAMQGILSRTHPADVSADAMAQWAMVRADALLAALEENP